MPVARLLACLALVATLSVAATAPAATDNTTLTIVDVDGKAHDFPIATLLAHPDAVTLRVEGDPSYGDASPAFRAIPLAKVLAGLPVDGRRRAEGDGARRLRRATAGRQGP